MRRAPAALALLISLASVLLLLASPRTASAHAELERSEPAAGLAVPEAPERVDAWFTQELFRREGANTLAVFGRDGQPVHVGEAVIDDEDRTHMSVELQPGLPQGRYRVEWTTLSAVDGDAAEGSFEFTVGAAASTPSPTPTAPAMGTTPASAATPPPIAGGGGNSFPWWAVIAVGSIAATAALGAWALMRGGNARDAM